MYEAWKKCRNGELGRSTALLPDTRKEEDWGAPCGAAAQHYRFTFPVAWRYVIVKRWASSHFAPSVVRRQCVCSSLGVSGVVFLDVGIFTAGQSQKQLIVSIRSKDILDISVSGDMGLQNTTKFGKQLFRECVKHVVPFLLRLPESSSLWNLAWAEELLVSLQGGNFSRIDLCQSGIVWTLPTARCRESCLQ